jgi:carboxypeptidase Taq
MSALAAPAELARLRQRMAELADLRAIGFLLEWDQSTMMPAAGATARGYQAATLHTVAHERIADPEVGRLLDVLEPWAAGEDPDGWDARTISLARRDFEKAVRVPAELSAEMTRAGTVGVAAWEKARAAGDFGRFRDSLAEQVELRHRYAACFEAAHPYDPLLDDFEPGLTTAQLQPLLTELRDLLVPLVAEVGDPDQPANGGAFAGPFEIAEQRAAVLGVLEPLGFVADGFRLDVSAHPFSKPIAFADQRLTTRYDRDDLGPAIYLALHEFGHALYDAQIDPALERTALGDGASFGFHESQSRLWENLVGRSAPFTRWLHGRLDELLPGGFGRVDAAGLHRAVNGVRPSPIRVAADQTTYNLHIVLRVEVELALIEGSLAVDDVPGAWEEGMRRLLGIEVTDPAQGPLQDMHWGAGLIGYFPTYAIGNLAAAQLWAPLAAALPEIGEQLERGDAAPLREWLREHVHRHGRRFEAGELIARVSGAPLGVEAFAEHLQRTLREAGVLHRS